MSQAHPLSCRLLARLLRFYAHLVLVLRLLKQPVPAESANRILGAYVQVLEANNQPESLIAFYAATLEAESAVDSYAAFLASQLSPLLSSLLHPAIRLILKM